MKISSENSEVVKNSIQSVTSCIVSGREAQLDYHIADRRACVASFGCQKLTIYFGGLKNNIYLCTKIIVYVKQDRRIITMCLYVFVVGLGLVG